MAKKKRKVYERGSYYRTTTTKRGKKTRIRVAKPKREKRIRYERPKEETPRELALRIKGVVGQGEAFDERQPSDVLADIKRLGRRRRGKGGRRIPFDPRGRIAQRISAYSELVTKTGELLTTAAAVGRRVIPFREAFSDVIGLPSLLAIRRAKRAKRKRERQEEREIKKELRTFKRSSKGKKRKR